VQVYLYYCKLLRSYYEAENCQEHWRLQVEENQPGIEKGSLTNQSSSKVHGTLFTWLILQRALAACR